jgi:tetratricopeptide (TPR) repeat protein
MTVNRLESGLPECGSGPCEPVIFQLQKLVERNPTDWALRYRLGVCHSGQCKNHALVFPDLALEHLRSACKALPASEEPLSRAAILSLLGILYPLSATLMEETRLLCALECHEKAAQLYFEHGRFQDWARTQYNLGNTWCDLPLARFPAKWEQAIAHYELSLLFRTRQSHPDAYAATLENLGTAFRQRTTGDKAANVGKAIECYRRALRLCPAATAPSHWAALHNNLGNACLSWPIADPRTGCSHARHAIRHFDLASRIRTPERNLFEHAVTRLNRGQACLRLGLSGSAGWLTEAVRCLGNARSAFLRSGGTGEAALAEKSIALANQALSDLPVRHDA